MNNVRNVFRVLCILVVVLSFTNCQHDATTEEIQEQEATLQKEFPFTSSLLTKQDIEVNTKLSNQMRSLATLQAGSLAETVYNSSYNFTVHTDVVKFVESTENNEHSYTFPIARENSTGNELENLVFSYDEAMDDYTASLVTYHFSASQQQEFLLTQHVRTPHNISYEPLSLQLSDILGESDLTNPCTTNFTVYHITPDTGETFVYSSTNGNIQNVCQHDDEEGNTQCQVYTSITWDCPDGGSASGPSGSSTPSSSTTGGSGNNTDSGNTTPNTDDEIPNVVTSPISKEDVARITEELNATLGEGNWEFQDHPNSESLPSFDSAEELQAYIESLPNNVSASESSSQGMENGQVITRFSFPTTESLNIANIEVEIVAKTENFETGQQFEVVGINSYLSGLSVIMSWEPNSNYGVYTSSSNGNFKRIVMTGVLKRGIIYEGIDITHKKPCTITMEINKYDGADGYSNIIYN